MSQYVLNALYGNGECRVQLWPGGCLLLVLRPIQKAAKEWQMEGLMWMFAADNADVKADVEMMMELRTEMMEMAKNGEKILTISHSDFSSAFMGVRDMLTGKCRQAKDSEMRCGMSLKVRIMLIRAWQLPLAVIWEGVAAGGGDDDRGHDDMRCPPECFACWQAAKLDSRNFEVSRGQPGDHQERFGPAVHATGSSARCPVS